METIYNTAITYTQNRIEIRSYESNKRIGFRGNQIYGKHQNKKESRLQSNQRAKKKLINLIHSNFTTASKFITLTFQDNVTNLDDANKAFYSFIRKVRRIEPEIKYVSTIEFQKRGSIHYHLIINSDKKWDYEIYLKKWRRSIEAVKTISNGGAIRIENIKDLNATIDYLTKYLTKNMTNQNLRGKKSYLISKGLNKPIEQKLLLKKNDPSTLLKEIPVLQKFTTKRTTYYTDRLTNKIITYTVYTG